MRIGETDDDHSQNMEGRVASDQDLKLVDTLRYYQRDSNAAKALLVRRLRNLEKARAKNKDVHAVSFRVDLVT
jgi:hypothetical protein